MDAEQRRRNRFRDRKPDEVFIPDLNPYLKEHFSFGPPVLTATDAPTYKGRWDEAFGGSTGPLQVEIGSGNGFYLSGMAAKHPEQRWLGIEIRYKRVILCARKIRAAGLPNARITRYDAWWLDDLFLPGELDGLHINHPDPWVRGVEQKKRLLSVDFLGWAARALKVGATLRLKTDHLPYVDQALRCVEGLPFALIGRATDLATVGTPWPADDDVITNYQSKFIKRGLPVHAAWLRRIEGPAPEATPEMLAQAREVGAVDDEEEEG
jgi:tRNA (guanine-N7-)-methyltransferase